MSENLTPETFDIDGWLTGASLPQRSVTIYQRPDLVADLQDLARRVAILESVQDAEATAAGSPEADELKALQAEQLAKLLEFKAGKLTLWVRALDTEELKAIEAATPRITKDDGTEEPDWAANGRAQIARSIVAAAGPDDVKRDVTFTVDQLRVLEARIGQAQFAQITGAKNAAQLQVPTLDADFLPKRSASSGETTAG